MDERPQFFSQVVQCAVSFALAAPVYLWVPPDNPVERLLAALIAGFGGLWVVMFCWTWLRHGWNAARGMTMGE